MKKQKGKSILLIILTILTILILGFVLIYFQKPISTETEKTGAEIISGFKAQVLKLDKTNKILELEIEKLDDEIYDSGGNIISATEITGFEVVLEDNIGNTDSYREESSTESDNINKISIDYTNSKLEEITRISVFPVIETSAAKEEVLEISLTTLDKTKGDVFVQRKGGGGGSGGGGGGSQSPAIGKFELTIISPQDNALYNYNESIPLEILVKGSEEVSSCWYVLSNSNNIYNIANCKNTVFNIAEGKYTLSAYAKSTKGKQISDNVVFEVDINEWNGNRELQLKIIDIKVKK